MHTFFGCCLVLVFAPLSEFCDSHLFERKHFYFLCVGHCVRIQLLQCGYRNRSSTNILQYVSICLLKTKTHTHGLNFMISFFPGALFLSFLKCCFWQFAEASDSMVSLPMHGYTFFLICGASSAFIYFGFSIS